MFLPASFAEKEQSRTLDLEQKVMMWLRIDPDMLFARLRSVYQDNTILLVCADQFDTGFWPLSRLPCHVLPPCLLIIIGLLIDHDGRDNSVLSS